MRQRFQAWTASGVYLSDVPVPWFCMRCWWSNARFLRKRAKQCTVSKLSTCLPIIIMEVIILVVPQERIFKSRFPRFEASRARTASGTLHGGIQAANRQCLRKALRTQRLWDVLERSRCQRLTRTPFAIGCIYTSLRLVRRLESEAHLYQIEGTCKRSKILSDP